MSKPSSRNQGKGGRTQQRVCGQDKDEDKDKEVGEDEDEDERDDEDVDEDKDEDKDRDENEDEDIPSCVSCGASRPRGKKTHGERKHPGVRVVLVCVRGPGHPPCSAFGALVWISRPPFRLKGFEFQTFVVLSSRLILGRFAPFSWPQKHPQSICTFSLLNT